MASRRFLWLIACDGGLRGWEANVRRVLRLGAFWTLFAVFLPTPSIATELGMTFERAGNGGNCNGCEWVSATGKITPDTPTEFAQFVARELGGADVKYRIEFDSPGGDLAAGVKLGMAIRDAGFDTSVGKTVPDSAGWKMTAKGVCASACAYAFLGGVSRVAGKGEIGLHRFYHAKQAAGVEVEDVNSQAVMGALALYVHKMGVNAEFLFIAANTDAKTLTMLSPEELRAYRVTTEDQDQFTAKPWVVEPTGVGAVAVSETGNSKGQSNSLSIFCSSKTKSAYIMLTATSKVSAEDLSSSMFSSQITIGDLVRRDERDTGLIRARNGAQGTAMFTFELTKAERELLKTAKDVGVSIELPHVYDWSIAGNADLNAGRSHVALALRNCL